MPEVSFPKHLEWRVRRWSQEHRMLICLIEWETKDGMSFITPQLRLPDLPVSQWKETLHYQENYHQALKEDLGRWRPCRAVPQFIMWENRDSKRSGQQRQKASKAEGLIIHRVKRWGVSQLWLTDASPSSQSFFSVCPGAQRDTGSSKGGKIVLYRVNEELSCFSPL